MTQPNDDFPANDDLERVAQGVTNRLTELGIAVTGEETPEELATVLEAVERFELAVQTRGGDLMVDEGPGGKTREPDDPGFALPMRAADEPVDQYVERLVFATNEISRRPLRDG